MANNASAVEWLAIENAKNSTGNKADRKPLTPFHQPGNV